MDFAKFKKNSSILAPYSSCVETARLYFDTKSKAISMVKNVFAPHVGPILFSFKC